MDGFQAKTISKKNIDIDKNIDFGITLKILGDLPIGIENIRMFATLPPLCYPGSMSQFGTLFAREICD